MTVFLKFFVLFLLHAHQVRGTFNCNNIQYTLVNETKRSTTFKSTSPYKCDRGVITDDHWYRFSSAAGNTMPTENPGTRRCGTYVPIWFSGEHPTEENVVVNATACAAVPFVLPIGCGVSYDIKVVKCPGNFYLYRLKEPKECSLAYCAGTMDPQECTHHPGTATPLCPDAIPAVESITASPSNDNKNESVRLKCSWVYNGNATLVKFKVRWIGDEMDIKRRIQKEFTGSERREYFYHFQWSNETGHFLPAPTQDGYQFNKEPFCEIQASYKGQGARWSQWKRSNKIYTGISIFPTTIRLNECGNDKHITVTLRPYLPINGRPFAFEIESDQEDYLSKVCIRGDLENKPCRAQLTGNHSFSTPMYIELLASCRQFVGPNKKNEVDFKFASRVHDPENNKFWNSYEFDTIKVYVDESEAKETCHSVTDPHFRTFDGMTYNFMGTGTFLLYRNPSTGTEVQTRQKSCNWRNSASCNCGVAIKEGFFYQIFDMCHAGESGGNTPWWQNPQSLVIRRRRMANSARDGFFTSEKAVGASEMHYEVNLPSGVVISVQRRRYGLSTYVKASKPNNAVEGLCGNFNGNKDDEFGGKSLLDFTKLNSINDKGHKNIFNYEGDNIAEDKIHERCRKQKICICSSNKTKSKCKNEAVNECFPGTFTDGQGRDLHLETEELCGEVNPMTKRALAARDDSIDDQDDIPPFDPPAITTVTPEWPTPSGLTETKVTELCNEKVRNSRAGQSCERVTGVDIDNIVSNCISDVQATDNIEWAMDNFGTLESTCKKNILTNITYYKNSTDGKLEVETEIFQYLCPNDCSNHGNCSNSTCICDSDYTAPDCSISLQDSPLVFDIRKSGLCDVRRRPCRNVGIYAFPLLDSENLTCHLQEYKVTDSGWIPSDSTMLFPGKVVDLAEVKCFLPESPVNLGDYGNEGVAAAGLRIAVSNNRINVSKNSMLFITFDSVCQECNTSSGCRLKNDSCLITGHCFAQNETHPDDWCQQCLSHISNSSWEKRRDNRPPMFTTSSDFYAFRGKQLRVQLTALDPEIRTIRYSLISLAQDETFGSSLTDNGLFIWTKDSNEPTIFTFKVTDECGAYSLLNVSVVIKKCPCQNLGECIPDYRYLDGTGKYKCSCSVYFTGSQCEHDVDECAVSNPCFNGTCSNDQPGFSCSCFSGYTGDLCQTEVDECASNPCFLGVTCTDMISSFSCGTCPIGYSGNGENCTRIDGKIDRCVRNPEECHGNGNCVYNNGSYICQCKHGYIGDGKNNCTDINECEQSPSVCHSLAACSNLEGSFLCQCGTGYNGDGTVNCTDVDECAQPRFPCHANALCTNRIGSYSCECVQGYFGDGKTNCTENNPPKFTTPSVVYAIMDEEFQIRIQAEDPEGDNIVYTLMSNGTLTTAEITELGLLTVFDVSKNGTVYVKAEDGKGGENIFILNMRTMQCPCEHSGECFLKQNISYPVQPSHYSCHCKDPYTGRLCEIRINPCDEQPCYPGLMCFPAQTSREFTCEDCPPLFEGDGKHCELNRTNDVDENAAESKIKLQNVEWDEQLSDKTSNVYKKLVSRLTTEMRRIYASIPEFSYFIVKGFRPGSVIVEFELIFSGKVEAPLDPLLTVAKTSKLGNMTFEIIEEPGQQENEDENRDITTQIVIIVAVVVLVLIVVLVVCLIVRRRRIHKEETIRGKKDANRNEEKAKGISYQEPANDIGREEMDLKVFDNEVVRFGEDVNVEP